MDFFIDNRKANYFLSTYGKNNHHDNVPCEVLPDKENLSGVGKSM